MKLLTRLGRNRLLDVGGLLIAVATVGRIALMLPQRAVENDFAHYYVSSRLALEGQNLYRTSLAPLYPKYGFVFHPRVPSPTNPPVLVWLFAPFAVLRPAWAFGLWVALQTVSLGVVLWLTKRLLRGRLSERGWRFVCAGVVASQIVYWHFYFSQVQLLLVAVVLLAYVLLLDGRHEAACLAVTAAGLLKLFPFVLLPWFIWRARSDFRGRARLAGISAALILLVVAATGPALWVDFFAHGVDVVMASLINNGFTLSLPSLMINIGAGTVGFGGSAAAARVWWGASLGGGLVVITLAYVVCLRMARDREVEFCLLCVAMLVCGITGWVHYLVFLIFPMAVAAVRVATSRSRARVIGFGMLWLLLLNSADVWGARLLEFGRAAIMAVNHTPLYAMCALGVFFARELRTNVCRSEPLVALAEGKN